MPAGHALFPRCSPGCCSSPQGLMSTPCPVPFVCSCAVFPHQPLAWWPLKGCTPTTIVSWPMQHLTQLKGSVSTLCHGAHLWALLHCRQFGWSQIHAFLLYQLCTQLQDECFLFWPDNHAADQVGSRLSKGCKLQPVACLPSACCCWMPYQVSRCGAPAYAKSLHGIAVRLVPQLSHTA